jgi:hypothetical protein
LTVLVPGGDSREVVRLRPLSIGLAGLVAPSLAALSCGIILGIPGAVGVSEDATREAAEEAGPPPAPLSGVGPYCLGYGFACAVVDGGTQILCWGRDVACLSDASAQAGTPAPALLTPTALPLPQGISGTVTALACGTDHACALVPGATGTGLVCWGQNQEGQITGVADGVCHGATEIFATDAALHQGYHLVQAVSAGDRTTCAIASDTKTTQVQCWGALLADGQAPYVPVPDAVNAHGAVPTSLSVGGQHACAYVVDGGYGTGVYCWGRDTSDQLGPVVPEAGLPGAPVAFHATPPVTALTASVNLSCYQVDAGDPIMCVGTPVGLGCAQSAVWVPVPANPPLLQEAPAAGVSQNCFLEYSDASALDIRCLGDNSSCQLGYVNPAGVCGPFAGQNGGVVPPLPAGVAPLDVLPNGTYACITGDAGYGLVSGYEANCNDSGTGTRQCTDAEPADRAQFPWASGFVCARGRNADGTVGLYCWGSNAEGELGRGDATVPSPYPTPVIAPH